MGNYQSFPTVAIYSNVRATARVFNTSIFADKLYLIGALFNEFFIMGLHSQFEE